MEEDGPRTVLAVLVARPKKTRRLFAHQLMEWIEFTNFFAPEPVENLEKDKMDCTCVGVWVCVCTIIRFG